MRVRTEHWQLIINFAEQNPEIITNKFKGSNGKQKLDKLWQELVNNLNAMGYGEKSVPAWRKALTDWKSKTKSKAAEINDECKKTGGGPSSLQRVSDLEERLLKLMGQRAIEGDPQVEEMGFGRINAATQQQYIEEKAPSETSIEEPNINLDHTYGCSSKKKNNPSKIKKIQIRRRKRHELLSQQLLEMNENTLNVLKSIDKNLCGINSGIQGILKEMTTSVRMEFENV